LASSATKCKVAWFQFDCKYLLCIVVMHCSRWTVGFARRNHSALGVDRLPQCWLSGWWRVSGGSRQRLWTACLCVSCWFWTWHQHQTLPASVEEDWW